MILMEVPSTKGLTGSLTRLLKDSVDSGASVGFLPPISDETLADYWRGVEADLQTKSRKLYVALEEDEVVGAVQLALCHKANGAHRGEVEKLMVHRRHRGRGLSKSLMTMMESEAAVLGLSLLVLDTRLGDVAAHLYHTLGYTEAGRIPQFAKSADGTLDATVLFYKLLSPEPTE
ncbi:GNAT family N-acetyltransferase [Ferrimonas balearica]|uniref:GNAT family N-acetyltransferase n=1 Tax=Ferrimonas balearica TaxID=44012 RepID=UPI001C9A0671|nr:GNAT family N-acetyltransferase [Ferrimonas balearica]MBY5991731.1 GNAT family N-acetyltransferase [Ferrimonas balearica]